MCEFYENQKKMRKKISVISSDTCPKKIYNNIKAIITGMI